MELTANEKKARLEVRCPTCGASPGVPCHTRGARLMERVHGGRRACTCATPCVIKDNRCDYCGGLAP